MGPAAYEVLKSFDVLQLPLRLYSRRLSLSYQPVSLNNSYDYSSNKIFFILNVYIIPQLNPSIDLFLSLEDVLQPRTTWSTFGCQRRITEDLRRREFD